MLALQEIGFLLRLIFVYGFNLKKINKAHKEQKNHESKMDLIVGLLFVLSIILIGFIGYFIP